MGRESEKKRKRKRVKERSRQTDRQTDREFGGGGDSLALASGDERRVLYNFLFRFHNTVIMMYV